MFEWRVTKYDPRLRDSSGAFRGDDWTSASEIGTSFGGIPLDRATYLRVEDAHVAAAMRFLEETSVPSLAAIGLEEGGPVPGLADLNHLLTDGPPVREGERLAGSALERAIRLNLRSLLWCRLEEPGVFFLHFGYDYYMYVGSHTPCPVAVRYAEEIGLFVEEFRSPYRV